MATETSKKMLALAETMIEANKREVLSRNRHVSHVEWALQDLPGVSDLLEYEARANYLVDRCDDAVICNYDLSKFGRGCTDGNNTNKASREVGMLKARDESRLSREKSGTGVVSFGKNPANEPKEKGGIGPCSCDCNHAH